MALFPERVWKGYLLALLATLLALGIRISFGTADLRAPFLSFILAIMITAWYGGFKPGLCATVLSTIVSKYYFIPPVQSLAVRTLEDSFMLAGFILVGVSISALC